MKNELTNNLQKLETNLNRLNNMEKQFISTTAQIKEFREINREMRDETANLASALRGTPGTPGDEMYNFAPWEKRQKQRTFKITGRGERKEGKRAIRNMEDYWSKKINPDTGDLEGPNVDCMNE